MIQSAVHGSVLGTSLGLINPWLIFLSVLSLALHCYRAHKDSEASIVRYRSTQEQKKRNGY